MLSKGFKASSILGLVLFNYYHPVRGVGGYSIFNGKGDEGKTKHTAGAVAYAEYFDPCNVWYSQKYLTISQIICWMTITGGLTFCMKGCTRSSAAEGLLLGSLCMHC